MDRFPPELLHSIFIQLDLKQRLQCTLVCRSWWSVLDKYSLLCNVDINNQLDQFDRFMNMITQAPHRAAQVETLTIKGSFKKDFNKRTLCNTFPNLRYIGLYYWGAKHPFSEPIEVTQTASKIQHIHEHMYCQYALEMMHSKLCGQLETLELKFDYRVSNQPTIIRQLKNMPVLKRLVLDGLTLSIADMEILHVNVPSIQTLKLSDIGISDSEIPVNIIPTTSLTNVQFEIGAADNDECHARWYLYASKKYVDVKEWSYEDLLQNDMRAEAEYFYNNGFLQFLEIIAPTVSSLRLEHLPASINIFDVLDNAGAQIEKFDLRECPELPTFQNLAESNQSNCITDLHIYMSTNWDSFPSFQNLTSLATLTLEFDIDLEDNWDDPDSGAFNLTDFLNLMPDALKKLNIYHSKLKADPVNCNFSSIQYLSISCQYLTKGIMDTVSTCFPKLVEVKLTGWVECNLKIELQSQFLKSAIFCIYGKSHGFSFKCPTQIKPQHYLFTNGCKAVCATYEEVKTKPILSVVSYTTKSLKFTFSSIEISS